MHRVYIAVNCLNCNNFRLMHDTFTLRLTTHLANQMEPYGAEWLPPMEMLEVEISN